MSIDDTAVDSAAKPPTPEQIAERTRGFVGYNYEYPVRYFVSREKVREYSNAVQALDPIHHDVDAARAAGYPDLIAPLNFFCMPGMVAHKPLFEEAVTGYGAAQIMQADQRAIFHTPIFAGDTLRVHVHLESFRQAAGVDMIVTRNEIFDENDVHKVSSWTTLAGRLGAEIDPNFYTIAERVMMHGTT